MIMKMMMVIITIVARAQRMAQENLASLVSLGSQRLLEISEE